MPIRDALAAPVLTTLGPPAKSGKRPHSVAFSPDATLVATADRADNTVSMFKVSLGGVLSSVGSFETGSEPFEAAFSADGEFLATADGGADGGGDAVSLFKVTRSTGDLKFINKVTSGYSPQAIAFSQSGRLVASADRNGGFVTVYAVRPDGLLHFADRLPDPDVNSVAFSSTGLLATTSYDSNLVRMFAVSADGALTKVGEPILADRNPRSVAFSPDGSLLATANLSGDSVSMYSVSDSGALSLIELRIRTGDFPVSVAFSRDGKLLATANREANSVSMFSVSADGKLTRIPTASATTATGQGPNSVAFSKDGRPLLAAANSKDDSVSMFSVSRRGMLTPIGTPSPTGPVPTSLAFDREGGLLATANRQGNSVSVFSVLAGGMLQQNLSDAPIGNRPLSVAISDDGFLATANHDDSRVTVSKLSSTGALAVPRAEGVTSAPPYAVAFRPGGGLLVSANPTTNSLSVFEVSAAGAVTTKSLAVSTGRFPVWVAFSPDGKRLATANQQDNSVRVFTVDDAGVLVAIAQAQTDLGPASVAFSPNGRLIATANDTGESVSLLELSDDDVLTTLHRRIPAGRGPAAVAFSKDGKLLATANRTAATTSLFRVLPNDTLVGVGAATPTGPAPSALAFSPLGTHFAVANAGGRSVSMFSLAAPALDSEITSGPGRATASPSASFEFESNYPSTFECRVDDGEFEACSTPKTYPGLPEGDHLFAVRGKDLVGNLETTPDEYPWRVDLTPPVPVSLLLPAAAAANLPASVVFSWSPTKDALTEIASYELLVDDIVRATVSPLLCTVTCSRAPDGGLSDGPHTWKVRAVDGVGRPSDSQSRPLHVDAAPPSAAALSSPVGNAATAARRPMLSWQPTVDAGVGLAGYDVLLDDVLVASPGASETSFTPGADLADGTHNWQVVARDAYGNRGPSAVASFVVDTAPPVANVNGAPNPSRVKTSVTFEGDDSTDGGSGIARYEWDLDGDSVFELDTATTASTTKTFAEPAKYVVQMRVTDRAGNSAIDRVEETVNADPKTRPNAGITINDEAPFTNDRTVTLDLVWPQFATQMLISNDGGFKKAQPRALQAKVTWELDATTERDSRTVYVRFIRGLTEKDYSDNITLDERKPLVVVAKLIATGREPALMLKARDRGPAGLEAVQFTNNFRVPKAQFRKFRGTVKIVTRKSERALKLKRAIYVRVRDRAGNLSPWRTAKRGR